MLSLLRGAIKGDVDLCSMQVCRMHHFRMPITGGIQCLVLLLT